MPKHMTIILAASNHMADSAYASQMIPIRGKPALAWVNESCDGGTNIVVLDASNKTTINYFSACYPNTTRALINPNEHTDFSILSSLLCGLNHAKKTTQPVRIVLGDTLLDQSTIPPNTDCILVSDNFSDSTRWCLVNCTRDGYIKRFFDKQNVDKTDKFALVGVYQFTDFALLKQCVADAIKSGRRNISDVLAQYNKTHKIRVVPTKQWFDLGHKSGIISAQNHLFNSRSFNSLHADPVLGIMTKASPKKQKLHDEWMWCKNLPDKLQILCPRPIDFHQDKDLAYMTMELYGYPALSELFILGNLSVEEWKLILERLFLVHREIEQFSGKLDANDFIDLYKNKTWKRFDELLAQDKYWQKIWNMDELVINGKKYKNIRNIADQINHKIDKLVSNTRVTVMHGDYCFSNILFDTHSFICRLIDPRGRLSTQTIYGDPRYDIAKLRHSVVGLYDFVVHGMFKLTQSGNRFSFVTNAPTFHNELCEYFDGLVRKFGYNNDEINLIEALLFASMIPLHSDDIKRQTAFYLKAVMKLNNLVTGDK